MADVNFLTKRKALLIKNLESNVEGRSDKVVCFVKITLALESFRKIKCILMENNLRGVRSGGEGL